MPKEVNTTCRACGFVTLNMPEDRDEICSVCGWQDDQVQQAFPASSIGANKLSLCSYQVKNLTTYPIEIAETRGFRRDSRWRPLNPEECQHQENEPRTGEEWFAILPGELIDTKKGK